MNRRAYLFLIVISIVLVLSGCTSKKAKAIEIASDTNQRLEKVYDIVKKTTSTSFEIYDMHVKYGMDISYNQYGEWLDSETLDLMTRGATELYKEDFDKTDEECEKLWDDYSVIMFYPTNMIIEKDNFDTKNHIKYTMNMLYKGYEVTGVYDDIDEQLESIKNNITILESTYEKYGYADQLQDTYDDVDYLYILGKDFTDIPVTDISSVLEEYYKKIEMNISDMEKRTQETKYKK